MKKLRVELGHCYGIKKMIREFDFSRCSATAIYAPNGSMKSSLAQVFRDIAEGVDSSDRVFPDRKAMRKVTDEYGKPIAKDCVLVIGPYKPDLRYSGKTATLLVNPQLRERYEDLHVEVDAMQDSFCRALKAISKSKLDIEAEVSNAILKENTGFRDALRRVMFEVNSQTTAPFADIPYDLVFNEKVLLLVNTKGFKEAIGQYIEHYNRLLSSSTYFRQGVFNYYNATTIAKSLADNGFFDARHTVSLNAGKKIEISSREELEKLIAEEKDRITNDQELKSKFAAIDKVATKNEQCREFMSYIEKNVGVIPELQNYQAFKEKVWKSYFKALFDQYSALVAKYHEVDERRMAIEVAARSERTQWERVIEIFNDRFFVPFTLSVTNKVEVMLRAEPVLSLGFTFNDGSDKALIEEPMLMQVLSTGEKKALYILDVLFEIERRKDAKHETLLVVDDIADSFDYKNKYAIIQYLKDLADEPQFKQIILTHNFDFFRTIESRFVDYDSCLMASKTDSETTLSQAQGIKNIFVKDWKGHFFSNARKRVASIPFIRNLVEYTRGEDDNRYKQLTSLLHWRGDSDGILQSDLDAIFNETFGTSGKCADSNVPVVDVIAREALECLAASSGVNFEHKIVLSIAIRLAAERFMCARIFDSAFVAQLAKDQSSKLFKRYEKEFPNDGAIETLQRVLLMTPANIHLNSFMYEPILDMSDEHLRKLYGEVLSLR